jgi:Fe-S cluster biogenesis protein NfuA
MEEKVKQVLDQVRPMLQADGGDVRLVAVDEDSGVVTVALQGVCLGCPHAQMTLKNGIEAKIRQEIPEVKEVLAESL